MSGIMMKVLCVTVACMLVAAPYTEAIGCGEVVNKVLPCLTYLQNGGPVPASCCSSIRSLNSAAKSTPDRKTACNCLKSASSSYPKIKADNAVGLAGKCGVSLPYKISPDIDCSKVK